MVFFGMTRPLAGIEIGTSRTRREHSTTRLSRQSWMMLIGWLVRILWHMTSWDFMTCVFWHVCHNFIIKFDRNQYKVKGFHVHLCINLQDLYSLLSSLFLLVHLWCCTLLTLFLHALAQLNSSCIHSMVVNSACSRSCFALIICRGHHFTNKLVQKLKLRTTFESK